MNKLLRKVAWKILGRKELHIEKELCVRCGKCYQICNHGAILQQEDNSYEINATLCHRCNHCLENCPKKAITSYDTAK